MEDLRTSSVIFVTVLLYSDESEPSFIIFKACVEKNRLSLYDHVYLDIGNNPVLIKNKLWIYLNTLIISIASI